MSDIASRRAEVDIDVVVVGASAAGLRAATQLAAAGLTTAVLERQIEMGRLERTWIVTPEIEAILGFTPEPAVVHRTGVMELRAGRQVAHVALSPPDLVVERAALIPILARRAEQAGVELLPRVGLEGARPDGRHLALVVGANGRRNRIRTRYVVGADGVRSLVARTFGLPPGPAVPVLQAKVRLPAGYDPDVTKVWFRPGRTRFFYWLIPDSTSTGVAGLVTDRAAGSRQLLDEFLDEHGYTPLSYQGAMIPLYASGRRVERRVGEARVLLVGDAAGHVKVTTVGGLVSGLSGANAAARALIAGTSYRSELHRLERELRLHGVLRWMLDRFDESHCEELVRFLNPSLREFLGRRNRDSMAGAAWRLLVAQPRLLSLGLRALLGTRGTGPRATLIGPTVVAEGAD